jgi:hypothetical protein
MTREYHILNLGAGVQSTALYLMSLRQDEPEHVPAFDCAIFADTQDEPAAVYDHLGWLESLDGPPILKGTAGKLGDDLVAGRISTGQRFASIPAFTSATEGQPGGMTRRQCTREYKVDVIERVIRREILGLKPRQWMPRDVLIVQYIGLSFDEPGRIITTKARFSGVGWAEPRFPLFDLQMARGHCRSYLAEVAPGRAIPRSACVFCPYRSNREWRDLRDNHPDDWDRACDVDERMRAATASGGRGLDESLYVHRSCLPLRQAPIDTPESRGEQYTFGFAQECEGMCGV